MSTEEIIAPHFPENAGAVCRRLCEHGYSAYLVGGCVRDMLRGTVPHDFDITTDATPDEMLAVFADHRTILTGAAHGTVTVVEGGENIEVTTFRADGVYSDHRRPDTVSFSRSIEEDLARRDFTVNAMALSYETGEITDLYGGREDLANGVIRCVGDPGKRFEEDALRIMRALRFSAVFDFDIEENTARAVHEKRELLSCIAPERISSELVKLLCGKRIHRILVDFADVFSVFVPEIIPCIGFDQKSRYHRYDVWEHIAVATQKSVPLKNVRLALFMHDIEKPAACFEGKDGHRHFAGHEAMSGDTAEVIMRRLRFDKATVARVSTLIRWHYVNPANDRALVKRLLRALGPDAFFELIEVEKGDNSAKQDFCLERIDELEGMRRTALDVIARGEAYTLSQLCINGGDITGRGIAEGAAVGETLDRLLDEVIDGLPNERDVLLKKAAQLNALGRKDLEIDGKDLLGLGFEGREIGVCLEHILSAVNEKALPNEHDALMRYAQEMYEGL